MTVRSAIFVLGPTAIGKTRLALGIARNFGCEIISVDSGMVYRGMDIGTAKPDAATLARFPHRLVDIRSPEQSYSAGDFREDALREMQAVAGRGAIPLLVGGTMLYFKALTDGLSVMPSADPAVRAELRRFIEAAGSAALRARLVAVDARAAARIAPADTQRLERAMEVFLVSGHPISSFWLAGAPAPLPDWRILRLCLFPADRSELYRRIEQRSQEMIEAGLVKEVESLLARHPRAIQGSSLRAVGYRQVIGWLDEPTEPAGLVSSIGTATRRLAKRQMTWMRGSPAGYWLDPMHPLGAKLVERHIAGWLKKSRDERPSKR